MTREKFTAIFGPLVLVAFGLAVYYLLGGD